MNLYFNTTNCKELNKILFFNNLSLAYLKLKYCPNNKRYLMLFLKLKQKNEQIFVT